MSKSSVFENKAFQKKPSTAIGFNLVHQASNFNSVFNARPLDVKEANVIEKLLVDNFLPGKLSEDQVSEDVERLKLITSEIRAIGRQGTVLMGERVHRARELLKPYRDGTFTKWLEATFGTRKTGYNMLSYYELYSALPHDDLRERLKKLPQRTAYMLASRDGDLDIKAEIISEYHDKTHDELVILIHERLPLAAGDKRKRTSSNDRMIALARRALQKLLVRKSSLSAEDRVEIDDLARLMNSLVDV